MYTRTLCAIISLIFVHTSYSRMSAFPGFTYSDRETPQTPYPFNSVARRARVHAPPVPGAGNVGALARSSALFLARSSLRYCPVPGAFKF